MFCDIALAQRIERCEQAVLRCANEFARAEDPRTYAREICGGFASYLQPGSPLNKVAGLGFAEFSQSEWREVEHEHTQRGAELNVELATLADPAIAQWLSTRDYRFCGHEHVLGLAPRELQLPSQNSNVVVSRSPDEDFESWLTGIAAGFAVADNEGIAQTTQLLPDATLHAIRCLSRAPKIERYQAYIAGEAVANAAMFVHEDVALLCGASTLPAYRRRGAQSALLAHRLQAAQDYGLDLIIVVTLPGSRSQRNAMKCGFSLLYARAQWQLEVSSAQEHR